VTSLHPIDTAELRFHWGHSKKHSVTSFAWSIDWLKVWRPTRHKIRHIGDVVPSQSLGLVSRN